MPDMNDCVDLYDSWNKLNDKYNDAFNDAVDEAINAEDSTNDAFETCMDVAENPFKIPVCITRGVTASSRWKRAMAKAEKAKEAKDAADAGADGLWNCLCSLDEEDVPPPPDDDESVWEFDEMDLTEEEDEEDTPDRKPPIVPKPK